MSIKQKLFDEFVTLSNKCDSKSVLLKIEQHVHFSNSKFEISIQMMFTEWRVFGVGCVSI